MDQPIFFSRDLSWIDFNARVLAEALKTEQPLLDRLRFISITASNFNEFFMVRVAALKRAARAGERPDPSGLSPQAQLQEISRKTRLIIDALYGCLQDEIIPGLSREKLSLIRAHNYTPAQADYLASYFFREIYPILTPLRISLPKSGQAAQNADPKNLSDKENFRGFLSNLAIYGAFLLERNTLSEQDPSLPKEEGIAVVQIPEKVNRIIWLPQENGEERRYWALAEDLLLAWGGMAFPGYQVRERMLFQINRDADFSVDEKRGDDFVEAMEEVLARRNSSRAVRMICSSDSRRIREALAERLDLKDEDIYQVEGPVDLRSMMDLSVPPGFERLRGEPHQASGHPAFPQDSSIWDIISQGDALIHLPYQSFDPALRFFQEAARDPAVIGIKTALYRTSGDSPIIRALEEAALKGKHVTAVVELKARFDEERNISWANRLERAGVIVVYGVARLKIHAKISLVIRREQNGIKRYVHLSTGNYNDRTAKLYEDIGLFTAREDMAFDAGLLFNMITGYSAIQTMRRLVAAPVNLKGRLIELIDREISHSSPETPGKILLKMNSLADPEMIQALYKASRMNVRIQLCVRGICMLKPGVPGLSENIQVVSVIDRFLEHSRIFYFHNGGAEEFYLSSADWMPRNLERRIELMFPVLQEDLQEELRTILEACFRDNVQAWELQSSGVWQRRSSAASGEPPFRLQEYFLQRARRFEEREEIPRGEFVVRRSPPEV